MEKAISIRKIPEDIFNWYSSQAGSVGMKVETYIRFILIETARKEMAASRKDNRMQYDSRDGNYHGTLPDGREIVVDGDVYAEQEQAGLSPEDLQSPLIWENVVDDESVRIVKK